MLSNLARLPYKMLLESGDCTNARFAPDFGKHFNSEPLIIEGDAQQKDVKLHPINRFLSIFDPEMWEITPDIHTKSGRPVMFPLQFLNRLLRYLTSDNLKTCRLVCKQWTNVINASRVWKTKLVGVIDGSKQGWLNLIPECVGANCATYIQTSNHRFSFWTQMRIKNLKSKNLFPLLTLHSSSFGRSVKDIRELSLINCELFWTDFLELMYHFRKVKKLIIHQCSFGVQVSFTDNLLTSLGIKYPTRFKEILEKISTQCPQSDYFFENLKTICIFEGDGQDESMTPLLLTLLKVRTGQMNEFEFQLGRNTSFLKDSAHQNYLWQSLHSFLATKNVETCIIRSNHTVSSGLVNRFFSFMNLWKFPPRDDEIWRLSNLTIDLRPLVLWSSFERHLIPLIQRLPLLKVLAIKNIVLRGSKSHFVKELIDQCDENCCLEIGLILDDQGGMIASNSEKELLSTTQYQKHLHSVEVIVHTDAIREIRDLFPYKRDLTFPSVKEFIFTTHGHCRPRFFSFNINMIAHNFPNLTELRIIDGPPFQYGSIFTNYMLDCQWKDMSGAVVGDEDIQLLLKNLVNLTKLVLRINLKYMTDSGFTGLSRIYCRKMCKLNMELLEEEQKHRLTTLEQLYRDGVSFSNLSKLKYLSIEGIGSGITDVTAFLAFRDVKSLEYFGFFGSHQISVAGKEFLERSLPDDCKIEMP